VLLAVGLALLGAPAWAQSGRTVVGSAHDLSRRGILPPGADPSVMQSEVCIHCHASGHMGKGQGPLWSRQSAPRVYTPYSSETMHAHPGQPDGSSKLCLSCHDGALATDAAATGIAAPVSRPKAVFRDPFGSALSLPAAGAPVLGTDLSDDHPVSFVYDSTLALRDGQLALPEQTLSGLGGTIAHDLLDDARKVQCTSCHDPHDNARGQFLQLPAHDGRLCVVCHTRRGYDVAAHSGAESPDFLSNCSVCHEEHGASRGSPLLVEPQRELCGRCHRQVALEMRPGASTRHAVEALSDGTGALTCSTCHDPHVLRPERGWSRPILTDPDDRVRPPAIVDDELTPHSYRTAPREALSDGGEFCLDCHDGTWHGAANLAAELSSRRIPQSGFRIDNLGLHASHARSRSNPGGAGCTYCHDAHGTGGNRGIPRRALLYEWLTVNDFPYSGKRSCSTSDVLGACHTMAPSRRAQPLR
jgi:predicted CXXCH cytochrome family protein